MGHAHSHGHLKNGIQRIFAVDSDLEFGPKFVDGKLNGNGEETVSRRPFMAWPEGRFVVTDRLKPAFRTILEGVRLSRDEVDGLLQATKRCGGRLNMECGQNS